jgi:DKNYY family protein
MTTTLKFIAIVGTALLACNSNHETGESSKIDRIPNDTLKKYHQIRELFYTKDNHLYQKTIAQIVNVNQNDTLHWKEYFNGEIPQDLDPMTFNQLDGWYAKDKNFVYYYRPLSGGMLISKMEDADVNSFEILPGHYRYAKDKNHVFEEMNIINQLTPTNLKINYDRNRKIISLQCGATIYKTE